MVEFNLHNQSSESGTVEPPTPTPVGPEIKGANICRWNPEDKEQWERSGKRIAFRNLWLSIPSLLCAFAVWMCWGVLTVQMLNLGFPFTQDQLFTLTSIAGLSGATLRIPSTFFIRLCGGRNTIWFTTALLLIPVIGTALALQEPTTPLWVFQIMALASGIGGGNFASSMSNISFYFPKAMQGLSLGLNAGLGNFGVTTMQILVPLAMTFGFAWQAPMILKSSSGTLLGKIPVGAESYIQNGSYVWLLILVPLFFTTWFGMNTIADESVSPNTGSPPRCFVRISLMLGIGFLTSAAALWLMLPATANGAGLTVSKWLILPCQIAITVYLLKLLPGLKEKLDRQYKIFSNHHTWVMTIIYTMTFGSFIGFSAALPLSIKVIFGFSHQLGADGTFTHTLANPNAPSALQFAWIGPFIGALIRPVGGWLADKLGGAKVTQAVSIVMVLASLGVAWQMKLAFQSATPEQYFPTFFALFLVLFFCFRHRQWLDVSNNGSSIQQRTSRPSAWLVVRRRRLWCFHHSHGIR